MDPVRSTIELLTDKDTLEIWTDICKSIPTFEFDTSKAKGTWLEKRVYTSLCRIGFQTLAGRVRELKGLSSIIYENDVLVFKPGITNRLLVVECKFRKKGSVIEKEMVMLFNQRIQDIALYFSKPGNNKQLLPMFVSSVPLDRNAFRFCMTYGILVIQPCFEETEYPQMISFRPPLGALRYKISKINSIGYENITRRLTKDIGQLHLKTVKFLPSEVAGKSQTIDGNLLEKAYFDILYRSKYLLRKSGGKIA